MSEEHDNGMWEPPIGNDVFINLRENESYYVDKSRLIAEIIRSKGTGAFLMTRPRRFGKSLLLSTLRAYWEGKRELFEGLKIEELEKSNSDAWKSYPVFYFDLKLNIVKYM